MVIFFFHLSDTLSPKNARDDDLQELISSSLLYHKWLMNLSIDVKWKNTEEVTVETSGNYEVQEEYNDMWTTL